MNHGTLRVVTVTRVDYVASPRRKPTAGRTRLVCARSDTLIDSTFAICDAAHVGINDPPQTAALHCPDCDKHVAATPRGHYDVWPEQYEGVRFVLLSCPACLRPFVLQHHSMPIQDDQGQWEEEWVTPSVLFPADSYSPDASVPENIAQSYVEARRVFQSASAYTSAAIMCRRTLEGICDDAKASGRNLAQKLDDLKARSIIDTRVHDWANHVLRTLGNDAAHDVNASVTRQDASDALDFTKAIIEYIYVFELAFKRFVERREARSAPKPEAPKAPLAGA